MRYHIITIFPDMFDSYLTESILGQAMEAGLIEVFSYDLRSYSEDKHRRVDGRVYGGGPGMVMWVDPIIKCYEDVMKGIKKNIKKEFNAPLGEMPARAQGVKILIVIFTPEKIAFDNVIAENVSKEYTDIIFICGRYEGIDARVKIILEDISKVEKAIYIKNKSLNKNSSEEVIEIKIDQDVVEWSVGPYVLTGGELPAMICIDAISRRIGGVLNNQESIEENIVSSHEIYGRPETYEGYKVPEVLLSGHHANIEKWKISKKTL